MSCLEIRDLRVRFRTSEGWARTVEGVDIRHEAGRALALVGETGCGKTTVARAILRLLPPEACVEGQVLFQGRDLLAVPEKDMIEIRGRDIAMAPQNPSLSLNPVHTVVRQVAEPFIRRLRLGRKDARARAEALMSRLGFPDPPVLRGLYPHQLSEGMNQRILIAVAFALEPRILIADEPTKGLDERVKEDVILELDRVRRESRTSLFLITHDLDAVRRLADKILVMYAGRIVEEVDTGGFFTEPRHPYSAGLIGSLPENGFQPIPGSPPSPLDAAHGCPFVPRCPKASPVCKRESPPLEPLNGRTVRCFNA